MSEYVFKLPDLGEGTVESEIAEWMVQVGETVEEEDPICSMLTDKAAVELSAPVTGTVVRVAGEVGDIIPVGAPLIVFETDAAVPEDSSSGSGTSSENPAEAADTTEPSGAVAPAPAAEANSSAPGGKVRTSPSIRRRARDAGVDLTQVTGSGPRGRILKADFDAFVAAGGTPGGAAEPAPGGKRAVGSTEIKVVGLRRKIAERMDQANREIPHFAYVEEVDVTALESLRRHLNDRLDAGQPGYTVLPFIGLALARVLQDFPQCNAHYDAGRNVIIRHHAVHLGIATQTDDGLKVPVVRHVEARSLADLANEIRRVSGAARDNSANRDELSGSTITLTSLGKLGGIVSTPIINLPEVAIIGVNKAVERPMIVDGKVEVRRMMNLSSSFDHRFVDGYDAAAMIQAMKDLLEEPATLFIR
ncbi:dihydrolipoamide acetyltransferase family protein [Elongatibacter sediminis]|uniref:Dihydrolipoamide acetyltransferase component of pyruvate dehydrogenase complex n=1 Tax=Elongatibacter sediminis TaxID=3119006 RepID=A0AAW9R6X9_9GAMM